MMGELARIRVRVILAVAALGLGATSALAQVSTWNNGTGGNWSAGGNWVEGTPPAPGLTTSLIFGSAGVAGNSYTATNDIGSAAFDLNALSFNGNVATLVTLNGADNVVNALNFTGAAPTITIGAGNATIANVVQLGASTSVGGAGGGTLTFGNSVTAPAAGVTLTKSSSGALVLAGGGGFDTLSVQAGDVSASGGTLALTAPTGAMNETSGLQLASAGGQIASFTASGGAIVNVTENIYIADAADSTATVTVSGAGTVLNNTGGTSGRLGVGNFGTGTLAVVDGGVVNAERLFSSRQAGSSSTVLVDGTDSVLHTVTQASFGSNGPGTVTVQNGGAIVSDGLVFNLGNNAVGNGVMTVTGSGSSLRANNPAIGALGTGRLIVKDGASATFTTRDAPGNVGLSVGSAAAATGTLEILNGAVVNVIDDGMTPGQAVIGESGTGTLRVESGSAFNVSSFLFAGAVEGSTGTVTVTGVNSTLSASRLFMGGGADPGGRGDLNVLAGANVSALSATFAQDAGSSSTSVVDGATLAITSQLVIGLEGDGSLTVRNGGTATDGGSAFVGVFPGGSGAATVTGSGSTLVVNNQLLLGGSGDEPGGTATLTASDGGSASVGALLVLFGGASVNVEGGSVNAGTVVDGVEGTSAGTINLGAGGVLNVTGTLDGSFSGVISGPGSITKSGPRLQFLSGDNTYQGGTTVNAGTLVAGHPRALGTGGVTINGTSEVALLAGLPTAVRLSSLTIEGGAEPTGALEIDNNKVIVVGGDVDEINGWAASGYNAGAWDGTGIISDAAQANTTANTGVGVALAEEAGLAGGTFGGEAVAAGDVLIAYALYGDANLDGQVGFPDLVRLAQNYNGTGKRWAHGDFDYDGNVGFTDLVKLSQNYNMTLAAGPIPGAPAGFEAELARAMAMVPEPAALGMIGFLIPALMRRRVRDHSHRP